MGLRNRGRHTKCRRVPDNCFSQLLQIARCREESRIALEKTLEALKVESFYRFLKVVKTPGPGQAHEEFLGVLQDIRFFNEADGYELPVGSAEYTSMIRACFRHIRELLTLMSNKGRELYVAPGVIEMHKQREELECELKDKGFTIKPEILLDSTFGKGPIRRQRILDDIAKFEEDLFRGPREESLRERIIKAARLRNDGGSGTTIRRRAVPAPGVCDNLGNILASGPAVGALLRRFIMRIGQNGARSILPSVLRLMQRTQLAWLTCAFVVIAMAQTPTETVIYSFSSFPSGANPYAPLFRDPAGNLYGTTNQGGAANVGVVFVQSASGYKVLYSFKGGTDGANPDSGVTLDSAGNIYGTTYLGGAANAGVVYKLSPSGQETLLYSFTGAADGANPYAGVILDSAGNLYGTTYQGGSAGKGVVYMVSQSGQETVLHAFTGTPDGANPYAGVISDSSGNLYGTTYQGGSNSAGAVYKVAASGQEAVLHSFGPQGADGGLPYAGVVRDLAGNLYGTTSSGTGLVYKISAAGDFAVFYAFGGAGVDPTDPRWGVVLDSAGNLYGTTQRGGAAGVGVVYKLEAAGGFRGLYQFPGGQVSGAYANFPNAGVVLDSEGNIYGTTPYGGVEGMIYKLDAAGQETTLYDFEGAPGGTNPFAGVTVGSTGNLYGTAGGGPADAGVVYKVDSAGRETALYGFTGGADGAYPESNPVLDSQGNVYGTTLEGGSAYGTSGFGVVYKIGTSGQETVLHTFTDGADGGYPSGVVFDSAGNLYGAAESGRVDGGQGQGYGVIYKLNPAGRQTIIYTFTGGADGAGPVDVVLDPAGNIYGSTYGGGAANFGVIYKVTPSGLQTVLYSFPGGPDGAFPAGVLARDSEGNLYGTTIEGGGVTDEAGYGVVFELDAAGNYAVLYRFTGGADGGNPYAGVVRDAAGNLYGTTVYGGLMGCGLSCGVVFKVTPSGEETVLYSFTGSTDGGNPSYGVLADSAGNLYGTTTWGGKGGFSNEMFSGGGVVYRVGLR